MQSISFPMPQARNVEQECFESKAGNFPQIIKSDNKGKLK